MRYPVPVRYRKISVYNQYRYRFCRDTDTYYKICNSKKTDMDLIDFFKIRYGIKKTFDFVLPET